MQKLHPNALWLYWFRSIFIIGSKSRNASKAIQPIVVLFIYVGIFAFVLSRLKYGNLTVFSPETNKIFNLNPQQTTVLIIAILFLYLILSFVKAYLYYSCYGYQINNNSIMVRKGLFSVHEADVPFDKIQNVDLFRGLLHQLLGLSSIHIQTAGYSEPVKNEMEQGDGFASEASIDGISQEEAEKIKNEIINKMKKS